MKLQFLGGAVLLALTAALAIILSQAERPPVGHVQIGYRGTAADYIYNPRSMEKLREANAIPPTLPPSGDVGPLAGSIYKNVQVLGDVHAGEFSRLMVSMTRWVASEQGCSTCHNVANFADDGLYTKRVARRMLQMVRHINADWHTHVQNTGVTCYTCHRGQLVPPNVWFNNPGPVQASGVAQLPIGKNHPSAAAAGSALPLDPYTPFLEQADDIHVQSPTALATGDLHTMKQTEWTYSFMLSISKALGVNCDYCHFTRAFADWSQSSPKRVRAWYGIRMVRDLNNHYLDPLQSTFPTARLGPALGDSPKVNCATCHNGVFKPLFGISMAKGFPELNGVPEN